MSNSSKNHYLLQSAPGAVGWLILICGLLHVGVLLAGDLSLLPTGLIELAVGTAGGFGLLLLSGLVLVGWSLVAFAVATIVSSLLKGRSST